MAQRNTVKIRAILLIVPLFILVLALAGGYVLVLRLFSLSVLVLLLSYLWAQLGGRGIEGEVRQPAKRCQVGDSFDEEMTVRNTGLLPKFLLKVWENTDLPGHSNRLAITLSPRGSYSWMTRVQCNFRGRYHLGPLIMESADPFGLFSVRRELSQGQSLLVYPATVELPFFWLTSNVESGTGQNYRLSTEPSAIASRVREYVPGDSLSRIHWRSTAHTGRLIVKDFDVDSSRNIWVVTDMSKASQAGDGAESIEEYCITIAASLIKKYGDSGRRAGLMAQGDDFYLFPPQTGRQHFWRVMEALALIKGAGQVPVGRLIEREKERLSLNSIVVIITSSCDNDLASSLLRLSSRGATVVVVLLDCPSFGGTGNPIAHHLTMSGIPVYVVKRGDDLAKALDSRGVVPADGRLARVA